MKRFLPVLLAALLLAGCNNDNKVVIKGSFTVPVEGVVYLDQSEVDRSIRVDSAVIKRGEFKFVTEVTGPEFYQLRFTGNEFVALLVMPGEKISLEIGKTPVAMNYNVQGSPGSADIQMLDQQLLVTKTRLDSITNIYNALSDDDIDLRGPELQAAYKEVVDAQRKFNIKFVVENISSMSSIQALYQRIDENTYVLYQPRDLQYLKIVSDSLSVRYPVSRHVRALKENVTSELNQMYIDRISSIAMQLPETKSSPDLPDINGKMVNIASLKGKYVLVSFWSTTSEASMNQLPVLRSIYNDYHRKGLEIYQISLDTDAEQWKSVVRYEEIPWISVREPDPENPVYARLMNVTSLPSNLLYDPEGNIINTNLTGRNLLIRMDQLFNQQR